jgi:hypothetical protein
MEDHLSSRRRIGIASAALLAAGVLLGTAAGSTPAPFELVFDGGHVSLAASANGLGHAGPFTSSGPFCAAGKAADQRVIAAQPVSSLRV